MCIARVRIISKTTNLGECFVYMRPYILYNSRFIYLGNVIAQILSSLYLATIAV